MKRRNSYFETRKSSELLEFEFLPQIVRQDSQEQFRRSRQRRQEHVLQSVFHRLLTFPSVRGLGTNPLPPLSRSSPSIKNPSNRLCFSGQRNTILPVTSCFLYISHTAWCLIGNSTNRCGFGARRGSVTAAMITTMMSDSGGAIIT